MTPPADRKPDEQSAYYLHVLRNPWGHSQEELRTARLWAADQIDGAEQSEQARDAARYRIAREHIAPKMLADALGLPWTGLDLAMPIACKTDELLDAELAREQAQEGWIDEHEIYRRAMA